MFKTRAAKLAIDKFPGEIIIVDLQSGAYYSLRKSACVVWERLETGATESEIINLFESPTDSQRTQLIDFVNELKHCNLLEEADTAPAQQSSVHAFDSILFEKYDDMKELILLDPIHEVDARGWPHQKQ